MRFEKQNTAGSSLGIIFHSKNSAGLSWKASWCAWVHLFYLTPARGVIKILSSSHSGERSGELRNGNFSSPTIINFAVEERETLAAVKCSIKLSFIIELFYTLNSRLDEMHACIICVLHSYLTKYLYKNNDVISKRTKLKHGKYHCILKMLLRLH